MLSTGFPFEGRHRQSLDDLLTSTLEPLLDSFARGSFFSQVLLLQWRHPGASFCGARRYRRGGR